ncbi:MAG: hypothetical protein IT428_16425 [Planctomycetaceae bacterium]|nr:hypothetical protein [Planctomycetaceae bacterium]
MVGPSKNLPSHATTLTTYAELKQYAQAFAAGHLQNLAVFGAPGLAKSTVVAAELGSKTCWISGNASPFGIYIQVYEHCDQPIVLDDVDGLHKNPAGIRLLKALCQTDPVRTLSWTTRAPELDHLGVPRQFNTTSPVALIANDWKSVGPNLAAVEDRMHIVSFEPTPGEIHLHAATWYWNQEIFDFIGRHLVAMEHHSLRLYVRAFELKTAEMDWKRAVLNSCFSGPALAVAQLKSDPSFPSEEDRARAFTAQGFGCRATYFNHARRIPAASEVPAITLGQTSRPQPVAELLSLTDLLRLRHKELGEG